MTQFRNNVVPRSTVLGSKLISLSDIPLFKDPSTGYKERPHHTAVRCGNSVELKSEYSNIEDYISYRQKSRFGVGSSFFLLACCKVHFSILHCGTDLQ